MAADSSLIKKPHQQHSYTEDQLIEFKKCTDPDTGYIHFMKNYFYIQHPVKGKLLFDAFPYQEKLLHSYHNYRQNINMMPRQSGKCLTNQGLIKIKHKTTGEEMEISIGEFYDMQKRMATNV